jgi:hypothetical protein
MRSVAAGFSGFEGYTSTLVNFMDSLSPLDSLSMSFWRGWTNNSARYWSNHPRGPPTSHKVCAKVVSIYGSMPMGLMPYIASVINWTTVTSLSLFNFDIHLLYHISKTDNNLRNLTRLQLCTMSALVPHDYLHELFEQNQNLQYVHLSLWRLSDMPLEHPDSLTNQSSTIPFLWPLRHKLQSLVFHDPLPDYEVFDDDDEDGLFAILGSMSPRWLEHVCWNYPHLQQLGLKASEAPLPTRRQSARSTEHLLNYLVSR